MKFGWSPMVNSHNSPHKSQLKKFIEFCSSYAILSIIFTLGLVIFSYKEVLELRYMSKFYSGMDGYSENVNRLLIDGYKNNLLDRFFGNLPVIMLILLLILVSYSLYATYRGTYHHLKVSKHFVNAKRDAVSFITLKHIALCSASFALPLLFWCYFLVVWFPYLIKYPLRYILGHSILPLILSAVTAIVISTILMHVGFVISRLSLRFYKHVLNG